MDESDADVISKSFAEPEAFGAIFDRHAATLLRYLLRRVGRATAEGLLGDLFVVAFEKRARFDGTHRSARASARPWLYGIASNLLLKHRRTEARRLAATSRVAVSIEAATPNTVGALDAHLLLPRVAEAILLLPDGEREALLLYVWEELSYQDIAAALEVPVGTVRSRLNRARTRLRELGSVHAEEKDADHGAEKVQPASAHTAAPGRDRA